MMIKKIISEPLLHFLILGFFLYIYYSLTSSDNQFQKKKVINISSNEITQIKIEYKKKWEKEINSIALKAYKTKMQYDKLLLSEAYALGLEKQDKVISDRLLRQMHFIMLNSSELVEPTEEELHSYYTKHLSDYSKVNNLSFSHIFFHNQKDEKISQILDLIKTVDLNATQAVNFGDRFQFSNNIDNITMAEAKIIYGNYFAEKLFKLQKGIWHNAIESKFGSHIVYITNKNIGVAYLFDEVEDRVYKDYLNEIRKIKEDEAYKKISSQYLFGEK